MTNNIIGQWKCDKCGMTGTLSDGVRHNCHIEDKQMTNREEVSNTFVEKQVINAQDKINETIQHIAKTKENRNISTLCLKYTTEQIIKETVLAVCDEVLNMKPDEDELPRPIKVDQSLIDNMFDRLKKLETLKAECK